MLFHCSYRLDTNNVYIRIGHQCEQEPSTIHMWLYFTEYDIKPSDFTTVEKKILLHHRFIEAMKFASPVLPFLGHNMTEEGEKVTEKQ